MSVSLLLLVTCVSNLWAISNQDDEALLKFIGLDSQVILAAKPDILDVPYGGSFFRLEIFTLAEKEIIIDSAGKVLLRPDAMPLIEANREMLSLRGITEIVDFVLSTLGFETFSVDSATVGDLEGFAEDQIVPLGALRNALSEVAALPSDWLLVNGQVEFYLSQVPGYDKERFATAQPFDVGVHEWIWDADNLTSNGYLRTRPPLSSILPSTVTPAKVKQITREVWRTAYSNHLLQSEKAKLRNEILQAIWPVSPQGVAITRIGFVVGLDERQIIPIYGYGFQQDVRVTLTASDGVYPIPPERTMFVDAHTIEVFADVTDETDAWTAEVVNPNGVSSGQFVFNVISTHDFVSVVYSSYIAATSVDQSFGIADGGVSLNALVSMEGEGISTDETDEDDTPPVDIVLPSPVVVPGVVWFVYMKVRNHDEEFVVGPYDTAAEASSMVLAVESLVVGAFSGGTEYRSYGAGNHDKPYTSFEELTAYLSGDTPVVTPVPLDDTLRSVIVQIPSNARNEVHVFDPVTDALLKQIDFPGSVVTPVISLDGQWIVVAVYVEGVWQLWRVHPDGTGKEQIEVVTDIAVEELSQISINPLYETIVCRVVHEGRYDIGSIPLVGGALTLLTDSDAGVYVGYPAWLDGTHIVFNSGGDFFVMDVAVGIVFPKSIGGSAMKPAPIGPDNTHVLYAAGNQLSTVSLHDGDPQPLSVAGDNPSVPPFGGEYLYTLKGDEGDVTWIRSFSGGDPRRIPSTGSYFHPYWGVADPMYFESSTDKPVVVVVVEDDDNTEEAGTFPPDGATATAVFSVIGSEGNFRTYFKTVDGSAEGWLTNNVFHEGGPLISPDGTHVVLDRTVNGIHEIIVLDLRTRTEIPLTENSSTDKEQPAWLGSKYVIFISEGAVYQATLGGEITPYPLPSGAGFFRVSFDGKYLSYHQPDDNGYGVYVVTLADGSVRRIVTGIQPTWSRDSTELFYSWGGMHVIGIAEGSESVSFSGVSGDSPVSLHDGTLLYVSDNKLQRMARDGTGSSSGFCGHSSVEHQSSFGYFLDEILDQYAAAPVRPDVVRDVSLPPAFELVPSVTHLLLNFPNPFNPETWFPYELSYDAHVAIEIYDLKGALIRTVDAGSQAAGYHVTRGTAVHWDGYNDAGERAASGVYFYALFVDRALVSSRKMVVLK